ncbi:hypothetical protein [Rhizobium sp.]|jgi:hypothetical protein|uniref:hypothetical protein n=1 Tax=Rhizobium sp. TaxID=391 RepID=UPI000E923EA2|nr:hypothetical protein [Rhizobium sp.]
MKKIKIFFLHNPKAAGTALTNVLSGTFPVESIAPQFSNSPYDYRISRGRYSQNSGYDFYAGHYGFDAFRQLQDGHVLVTNFRDPIQRIRSLYRYWSKVGLDGVAPEAAIPVRLAKELSFSDFIRSENKDLRLNIDNFHFRQLLAEGWKECSQSFSARASVFHRIYRMKWFFVSEMGQISLALLKSSFPQYRDAVLGRENVTDAPQFEVSAADAQYIAQRNVLDYDIYAWATALQTRRAAKLTLSDLNF